MKFCAHFKAVLGLGLLLATPAFAEMELDCEVLKPCKYAKKDALGMCIDKAKVRQTENVSAHLQLEVSNVADRNYGLPTLLEDGFIFQTPYGYFFSWDYSEHWMSLSDEGNGAYGGLMTVAEDFGFEVSCKTVKAVTDSSAADDDKQLLGTH